MGFTRISTLEPVLTPKCKGLSENGQCAWLNVSVCPGANCSFYHSRDHTDQTFNRLHSLDEETQQRIAAKYYGGSRPWAKMGQKAQR